MFKDSNEAEFSQEEDTVKHGSFFIVNCVLQFYWMYLVHGTSTFKCILFQLYVEGIQLGRGISTDL